LIGRLIRNPLFPRNCEYGDIVRGLPLAPSSCDVVYSSHVLEHLSLSGLRVALQNVLSILKPGGTFRLVVPDLESAVKKYLASEEEDRAIKFLVGTSLGKQARGRTMIARLRELIGNSGHLWMWDYRGLAAELKKAGFVEIRSSVFGDSHDPLIDSVEDEGRWNEAVGISCSKPT
jgi:predicted SAM-dependent methyltransferase